MQDVERRHLARELHDSAGQYLAGIQMNLSALLRPDSGIADSVRARISDSMDMAKLCTSEIRTMSYLLHPPLLDEMGLLTAISWYAEGFAERSGIRVDLEIPETFARLPSEIETALFRVVQQSLANIHRHSGSMVALIRINVDADAVRVEIRDEGRGISPEVLAGFHSGTRLLGVGIDVYKRQHHGIRTLLRTSRVSRRHDFYRWCQTARFRTRSGFCLPAEK